MNLLDVRRVCIRWMKPSGLRIWLAGLNIFFNLSILFFLLKLEFFFFFWRIRIYTRKRDPFMKGSVFFNFPTTPPPPLLFLFNGPTFHGRFRNTYRNARRKKATLETWVMTIRDMLVLVARNVRLRSQDQFDTRMVDQFELKCHGYKRESSSFLIKKIKIRRRRRRRRGS